MKCLARILNQPISGFRGCTASHSHRLRSRSGCTSFAANTLALHGNNLIRCRRSSCTDKLLFCSSDHSLSFSYCDSLAQPSYRYLAHRIVKADVCRSLLWRPTTKPWLWAESDEPTSISATCAAAVRRFRRSPTISTRSSTTDTSTARRLWRLSAARLCPRTFAAGRIQWLSAAKL